MVATRAEALQCWTSSCSCQQMRCSCGMGMHFPWLYSICQVDGEQHLELGLGSRSSAAPRPVGGRSVVLALQPCRKRLICLVFVVLALSDGSPVSTSSLCASKSDLCFVSHCNHAWQYSEDTYPHATVCGRASEANALALDCALTLMGFQPLPAGRPPLVRARWAPAPASACCAERWAASCCCISAYGGTRSMVDRTRGLDLRHLLDQQCRAQGRVLASHELPGNTYCTCWV